ADFRASPLRGRLRGRHSFPDTDISRKNQRRDREYGILFSAAEKKYCSAVPSKPILLSESRSREMRCADGGRGTGRGHIYRAVSRILWQRFPQDRKSEDWMRTPPVRGWNCISDRPWHVIMRLCEPGRKQNYFPRCPEAGRFLL